MCPREHGDGVSSCEVGRGRLSRGEFLGLSGAALAGASLGPLLDATAAGAARRGRPTIYHSGKIITGNDSFDIVEAVAIEDGRFLAVGSNREVRRLARRARKINLRGRVVVPGFFDNHIHLDRGPLQEWRGALIDSVPEWIEGAFTKEELAERIRRRAEEVGRGEWIVGAINREEWPNQAIPTRWDLDDMAPDNPVALTRGPHTVIINSPAFEITGITSETPDPPGGWIVRDKNGEPSGRILETAKRLVDPHLPPPEPSDLPDVELWRQFLTHLLSVGITSVNLAGVRPQEIGDVRELYEQYAEELPRMTMQVRLSPGYDTYDDPDEGAAEEIRAMKALPFKTGFGDERFRIGAIKMSIDGGLSAPVMWTIDHYEGRPGFHGAQRIPDETFYEVAKAAHDRGWQLGIHTIGDAASVMVVEQLERILRTSPRDDHRHYLHHMNVKVPEDTLRTMAELGIMAAIQPSWTAALGAYAEEVLGAGPKLETQNPSRSLLDHGIRISYGSDAAPYSPIFGIWDAVTRRGWDGEVYGLEEEGVTVEDAIRLHTAAPAFMTFEEDVKGSIEVGKLADLVVLGDDPLAVDPEAIKNISVNATVIGGRLVYERGAVTALAV